jgi:porphobilinogen synthase
MSPSDSPDIGRIRPRRRRASAAIRALVRQTRLTPDRLVLPLFVCEGSGVSDPIEAIPGRARTSIDLTIKDCAAAAELGIRGVCLLPAVPAASKTRDAREALREGNLLTRCIGGIKRELPGMCVMTDVALDPYNSDGHDGLVSDGSPGKVRNDATVQMLAAMAVLHARAGADVVAPSDMMDGRVGAIRDALDRAGFQDTLILSYTAKYASALYGPFRQALDSAPAEGAHIPRDKRTYQMDPANAREALIEARLDEQEGADILMVKPGTLYLDIIAKLRDATELPIAAYHVSGEYAMLKAAAARGWLDERSALTESLVALARAGADIIFTYGALDYARWWRENPLPAP